MDVGGSSVRVALVREDGEILASASQPTGFDTDRETMLARFRQALGQVLEAARERGLRAEGAGIGMPGFQDERGRVDSASNLPCLNGADLAEEVSRACGLPAAMENDMNLVALGEYHFGGHTVAGNLLVVAVGTGVGAAVVQDGRLLRVARGCLGDPGHMLLAADGRLCRCGARGCLEAYASGWAIVEQAEAAGISAPSAAGSDSLRPEHIFTAARDGHVAARALLERTADTLGMGLASFCALYQPQRMVLGGNVLLEGSDLLLPRATQKFRSVVQPWMAALPLALSRIPQTAGVLGGAALVFHHWKERLVRGPQDAPQGRHG